MAAPDIVNTVHPTEFVHLLNLVKTVFIPQVRTWLTGGEFYNFVSVTLYGWAVAFGSVLIYWRWGKQQIDTFDAIAWVFTALLVKGALIPHYAQFGLSLIAMGDWLSGLAFEHFLGTRDMAAPLHRLLVIAQSWEIELSWDLISQVVGMVFAIILITILMTLYMISIAGTQILALVFMSLGFVAVPSLLIPALSSSAMNVMRNFLYFVVTFPMMAIAMAFAVQIVALLASPATTAGTGATHGLFGGFLGAVVNGNAGGYLSTTLAQIIEYMAMLAASIYIILKTQNYGHMIVGQLGINGTVNAAGFFAMVLRGRV